MTVIAAKKRQRRPLYMRVERLVRPETGEAVGALVPLTKWDARAMRERKYHVGTEVRAELKKPRNAKFMRLAHAIGALMVDQHSDFAGLATHDALKRLQSESGAACETVEYDLPGIGKLTRTEPCSLAFDEMDEGTFSEVVQTIYRHIAAKYWTDLDETAVEELVLMYEKDA